MTNTNNNIFKTGDIVVGTSDTNKSVYSATGAKLIADGVTIYGSAKDLKDQEEQLKTLALRHGGVQLALNTSGNSSKKAKKRGRNITQSRKSEIRTSVQNSSILDKYTEPHEETYMKEESAPEISIQFENAFGRMRAKVEAVVEHAQAYMLIFKDEDAVVFEPKVGEELSLYINSYGDPEAVYYPGVTFNSPDSDKRFMILFKIPTESE